MKHGATRELFDYWNALRGARLAPERADIDPGAIRAILADTFMLDVAAEFPVRLAGTRAAALLSYDRTAPADGFLSSWHHRERHNVAAVLDAVVDGASPVVVGAAGAPTGRPECAFEMLFLPLRHFGKTHSRILGIATAAQTPSWLGFAPLGPLAIRSLRVVTPDAMERAAMPRLVDEMRPAPCRRDGRLTGMAADLSEGGAVIGRIAPRRPALRLIEGGRAN